jgi:hypothetical protein
MAAVDDPDDEGGGDTDDRVHRASCVYYRTGYNADTVRQEAPEAPGAPETGTGGDD